MFISKTFFRNFKNSFGNPFGFKYTHRVYNILRKSDKEAFRCWLLIRFSFRVPVIQKNRIKIFKVDSMFFSSSEKTNTLWEPSGVKKEKENAYPVGIERGQDLPSRRDYNVPQHIKLQDSLINPERKALNIKGGHHLWTLVYDSIKENTQSSEDARLKIKEALRSIYKIKSKKESIKDFSSETLAYAIYQNEKKQEIIVRFVGCEKFQMSSSNINKFSLGGELKPRVQFDITNRENLQNQMLEIKKNKDLDSLYFISEVKKASKKSYLHYYKLPSHLYSLRFIQSRNKGQLINSFDIEENLLNSLEKGVAKEYSEDFPQKFKIKFEIGFLEKVKSKKKSKRILTPSGTRREIFSRKVWKKKKIVKNSKSILFQLPIIGKIKKQIQISAFIPIYKLIKSINFIRKQMEKMRLLPMEGKVNIKAQRSMKSQNSQKNRNK